MKQAIKLSLPPRGSRERDQCMFDTGYTFHEAALRCTERVEGEPGVFTTCTAPMITCYALASELYLKALIQAEGGLPPKSHRLNVLFARLSVAVRDEVFAEFHGLINLQRTEFEAELQRLGAAFVDWRYIFEADGNDVAVSVLAMFARSLYLVIRQRQPTWGVTDYLDNRIRTDPTEYPVHVVAVGGGVVAIIRHDDRA